MMNKQCHCARKQHGGMKLSPSMIEKLKPKYTTLPVKRRQLYTLRPQRGMGHCQHGGNIFSDIGSAITGVFHDPVRAIAAVGTLGASEIIAAPADLLKRQTGVRASTLLDTAAPILGPILGPEAAMGAKGTSFGLKQIGLGRRGRPKKRVPAKRRSKKPGRTKRKR